MSTKVNVGGEALNWLPIEYVNGYIFHSLLADIILRDLIILTSMALFLSAIPSLRHISRGMELLWM